MKILLTFGIVSVALLGGGCTSTKTLAPDNAKQLLQTRFLAEDRENELIEYSPVAALMTYKTLVDYREDRFTGDTPDAAIHRLLKAGLVKQTIETRSFHFGRKGGNGHMLTAYQYAPTPKLLEFVVSRLAGPGERTRVRMFTVGKIKIDKVENLTFGGMGTSARGDYSWHVDYNLVGQAVTGVAGDSGVGPARFSKQNGSWVCVRP
jgi:hypothetical protein